MRSYLQAARSGAVIVANALFFCAQGGSAKAADCDFDKPAGSCVGSITVDSSGGSKPSFSAEITISTSETCSKVEYLLDNTPHQTVFKNSKEEAESLSSTKPISNKNIKITRCTVYLNKSNANNGKWGSCANDPEIIAILSKAHPNADVRTIYNSAKKSVELYSRAASSPAFNSGPDQSGLRARLEGRSKIMKLAASCL